MRATIKKWNKVSLLLIIGLISISLFVPKVNSGLPESSTTETDAVPILMNLWVESENSGNIEGSETTAGREGSMQVLGYHHQISASAESTNQFYPFRIVKYVDKASPLLMQAMCNRENLENVILRFYRDTGLGNFEEYYRIELVDAKIIQIESHALESGGFTETLSFNYMSITWIWIEGGIEYTTSILPVA